MAFIKKGVSGAASLRQGTWAVLKDTAGLQQLLPATLTQLTAMMASRSEEDQKRLLQGTYKVRLWEGCV